MIDYKTGEKARTPEKAHRDGARWTDLQLPLYRHLLAADGVDGEVGLAYFCLPGTLKEIEILEAGWSPEEIDEAVDVARGVVRDIRAGKFERNPDFPLHYRDAFETICQTRVFGAGGQVSYCGATNRWEDPDTAQAYCEAAGCGFGWLATAGSCCGYRPRCRTSAGEPSAT